MCIKSGNLYQSQSTCFIVEAVEILCNSRVKTRLYALIKLCICCMCMYMVNLSEKKVPMTAHSTLADLYVLTQNNIQFKMCWSEKYIFIHNDIVRATFTSTIYQPK